MMTEAGTLPAVDPAYLEAFLVRLLNTPSPTGFAQEAIGLVEKELAQYDNVSTRRIAFYERANFQLCRETYVQPPYEKGFEPIPMYLMEYGGNLTQTHFSIIVKTLHTKIYGIKIA